VSKFKLISKTQVNWWTGHRRKDTIFAMKPYPLKFRPIYKQRIWGGQKLRELFGKDIPAGEKIGESWELADLPDDKSVIANGELAGQTISSVIEKYPKEITGDAPLLSCESKKGDGPFPLLIKFLDAEDILSVQVHLVDCEYFTVDKGHQEKNCELLLSAGRMKTLIILAGFGTIAGADETSTDFKAGDILLVPAAYEGAMRFAADTQYLTVNIPRKNE